MLIEFKNKVFTGSAGRKSVFDCVIPENPKGMIIFVHGYKGYKDWGAWNDVQAFFAEEGYGFLKFNMSHNGGTVEDPIDFPDLEAFGKNTYSYELHDLSLMVDEANRMLRQELEIDVPLTVVGHSRGGGVALLEGAKNPLVDQIVTWAAISDIARRFPTGDELEAWQQDGVKYVRNGRTNQEMPHFFSFYEDFAANRELLDIEKAATELNKPLCIIHGDMDVSVSISEGQSIAQWTEESLVIIKGADHTFGTRHPWKEDELPIELKEVLEKTLIFLNL